MFPLPEWEGLSKEEQGKLINYVRPPRENKAEYMEGWRPSTKKFDPNDPRIDPMHPREGTPKELLEEIWDETYD
jgi:hypothetical protein